MGVPPTDDPEVVNIAEASRLCHRLARLLLLVARGAVAVCDAGFGRHTEDLDISARPVSARRLVKSLRAQGMKTFWITAVHAVA